MTATPPPKAKLNLTSGVIAELTKLAEPIRGLRRRKEQLEVAKRIHESLPEEIRVQMQDEESCSDFDMRRTAFQIAGLPIAYIKQSLKDTNKVLSLLEGLVEAQTEQFDISREDIEIIGAFVRMLGALRYRSKLQVKRFLESADDQGSGWLVIRTSYKSGLEARFMADVSQQVKEQFDF